MTIPSTTPQSAYESARKAYIELLTAKERTQIETPTSLSDLLSKTQALAKSIQQQQPQLLLRFGDAATKIKPFEALLAGVCKFAPKGGDLIWGSVAFVLELTRKHQEVFEEVLTFFVTMSDEMSYVKLLEETFKGAPLVISVIEALYIAILDFWVKAVKYYRPKPSKRARILSSIKNLTSSNYMALKFGLLKEEITLQKNRLHMVASAQHFSDSAVHHAKEEKARRAALVTWIGAPAYEVDLNAATKHHYAGTCEWILKKPQYVEWHGRRDNPLFVIYGIPGAGKTILSSWLIREATKEAATSGQVVLYHFFKASDDSKRTPLAAVRSLLEQLYDYLRRSNEALLAEFEQQLDSLLEKAHDATFPSLWFIFSSILPKINQSLSISDRAGIIIMLDALDECKGSKPLVRELHKLVRSSSGSISILVTSRKSGEHVDEFARVPDNERLVLEISRDDVKHDIASYTRFKIGKIERLRGDQHTSLRSAVTAELGKVENHQGMFLWSYLMCKEVKHQLNIAAIWRLLKNLPKGLDALYSRICIRLAENELHREFGKSVLQWIVASSRPLRFAELEQALKAMHLQDRSDTFFDDAVYDVEFGLGLLWSRKDIVEACGDLVTYSGLSDGDMIGLVHLSARHFLCSRVDELKLPPDLSSSSESVASFLVDIPKAECVIGTTCLDYLLTDSIHSEPQFVASKGYDRGTEDLFSKKYPLLDYAIVYWPDYAFNAFSNASDLMMPVDVLIEKASLFVGHPFSVIWLQEYVRHYGAETTSYIVRRFSGIPLGSAIQKIVEWAERAGKILSDFSRTLTRNPHLIRICLQPLDNVPNVFQPHAQTFISPESDVIPNTAKITSKYPSLENSSGRWVYYDSLTDSIFSVDILSDSICLRRHLLGKGIPLRPAVLETHEPDLYSFRSAAVSARAGFIAITFGSSGVAYERLRETYTTVCWSLITSGSLSRTSEWAEVAFVDKAEGPKVEQFVNTVQEVDIVAFREDNTLMAPGGIWNILTEERVDGAREIYHPGAFSSIQNLCFSKDGAKVARVHTTSDNDVIQILTADGTLLRESSYRRKSIRLLSFSRTGGKLVFDQRGDSIAIFCMITDTGFHIEFQRPPHFKFMQEPRFTKGEDRVVSTLFGVQVSDEDSGEHSFHQQGCSIGIWSLDRDSEGAFVSHASMIYLFKFWEGLDNITFCLNQLPSKRGHQLEDRMMVVTKTGTVIERNLNEAWTSQEEKDFFALGKESTTLQQSVLAEHITLRPMQPPEIIVCSNDGRDARYTMNKWQIKSTPLLVSRGPNVFQQDSRHKENCFFSSTGRYFIDVPENQFFRVHTSSSDVHLELLPLPFVIDGCGFSADDMRVALMHFDGPKMILSVFELEEGHIGKCLGSLFLNGLWKIGSRSDLDVAAIKHSTSSSRFNKIVFGRNLDVLAVSAAFLTFKIPLGTILFRLAGGQLIPTNINNQYMFSLRFSMCERYLYNCDSLYSDVPILLRLPEDISPTIQEGFSHPNTLKFGTFYVYAPYIFKLREDGQSGAIYLDRRLIEQDGDTYCSREICVKPDALPNRTRETTLIWPLENEAGGCDEVELVIASEMIVIKTGIRSGDMMKSKFWT